MADLQKIVEELSGLTLLEAAELTKLLEEKWGVSAAALAVAAGSGRRAAQAAPVAEEKTEFDVILTGAGREKDSGDQSGAGTDQPGTERSQRPGRRSAQSR